MGAAQPAARSPPPRPYPTEQVPGGPAPPRPAPTSSLAGPASSAKQPNAAISSVMLVASLEQRKWARTGTGTHSQRHRLGKAQGFVPVWVGGHAPLPAPLPPCLPACLWAGGAGEIPKKCNPPLPLPLPLPFTPLHCMPVQQLVACRG